jgi:TctA family transporter
MSAWLADRSAQPAAEILLAAILLVAAAITIWDARELPFTHWYEFNSKFYPSIIAGLLVITAGMLMARGFFLPSARAPTWSLRAIIWIFLCVAAATSILSTFGYKLLLQFGPPEFAALNICILVIAVSLARRSRLRATGMTLLGLLLATVGIDAITGQLRMTMGLEVLLDGFDLLIVAAGLVVIADSVMCLVSPPRYLQSYGWLVLRWREPRIGAATAIIFRVVATVALAVACWFAFSVNNDELDVVLALLFGALGIAGKIYGWNRFVLLVGVLCSPLLEQSLRQSMLISDGDPSILFRRPLSAALWLLAGLVLFLAVALSTRRSLSRAA